LKERSISELNS